MVGHLFGYEAALAIDAQARPLREARAAIDAAVAGAGGDLRAHHADGEQLLDEVRDTLAMRAGGVPRRAADGCLQRSPRGQHRGAARRGCSATRPVSSALDAYQLEFGKVGTPGVVLDDLSSALTAAIDELTRPVDAIKHQAKTVTVGISRSDESLLEVPLVAAALAAGAPRDRLTYSTLRSLGELDPAVIEVTGHTRYGLEHGEDLDHAIVTVVDRGGIASGLASRAEPRSAAARHEGPRRP